MLKSYSVTANGLIYPGITLKPPVFPKSPKISAFPFLLFLFFIFLLMSVSFEK